MDVNYALVAEEAALPHVLQERSAAQHPPGIFREDAQQPKLGVGQVDLLAPSAEDRGATIKDQRALKRIKDKHIVGTRAFRRGQGGAPQ
jgi:hypothetical protein